MSARPSEPCGDTVRFVYEGRTLTAPDGFTVAEVLTAHGVRVFARSSKFHRPRGLRCGNGTCSCCAMRVDGLPGVRTCVTRVRQGMVVEREGGWPSAGFDLGRAAELAAPVLHAGFAYSWFRRSPQAWRVTERLLARAAGQTALPSPLAAERLTRAHLERLVGDVVVVGGGVAGMSAAVAAAEVGAPVLLVERFAALGGRAPDDVGRSVGVRVRQTERAGGLRLLTGAEVAGWYEEGVLAVVAGTDLLLVEPAALVLASGLHERILPFAGGDLPGVLAAGGARRLLRCGALTRRCAVVVTDRPEGHLLAVELREGGVDVRAVADRRDVVGPPGGEGRRDDLLRPSPDTPVFGGLRDMRAHGRAAVRAVTLEVAGGGRRRSVRLDCDLVCVAVGGVPADELARQALARGAFVLEPVAPDPSPRPGGTAGHLLPGGAPLLLAGAVCGSTSPGEAMTAGEAAGFEAATVAVS